MNTFFQQWRIAEYRLLFFALLISVTAVSAVTFFTDRIDQGMQRQASQILGGDLVVQSSRPLAKIYQQQAESLGIRTAKIISFPSMVLLNDKAQLVQLKAVSANYPLFGDLHIGKDLNTNGNIAELSSLPSLSAWADPQLFIALGIQKETQIQLGHQKIQLTGIIKKSPDQGASAFEFMPQLLLSLDDLPATGLLTPASRAKFSLLLAGDNQQIETFKTWLKPRLQRAEKIRSLDDGLPAVQQALQQSQQFLSLATLLSVMLAGVAIALTSYSLSQRETKTVAVLKTLGASRRVIIWRYSSQLFILATVAAVLGILCGFIIQFLLIFMLQNLVMQTLPNPSLQPILIALLTAWVMVLGFSLPQLIRLVNISPVRIFQQVIDARFSKQIIFSTLAIALGMLILIWLQIQQFRLSFILLCGLIAIMSCFWLISILLLRLLRYINQHLKQPLLRLPKANFRIALLIMVFGMGFFSLLLLTALRTDLIDRWQTSLPANTPNYFLINIQPDDVKSVKAFFKQHQLALNTPIYTMVRGRLSAINNIEITSENFDKRRAKRMLSRELNLSTSEQLPIGNKIIEGKWFEANSNAGLSIDEDMAKALNLKLGDILTFDIAGEAFKQTITSIRVIQWDNMQPNFLILTAPLALQNKPRTFMTSLYIAAPNKVVIPQLIQHYPSVTAIDISNILEKIKSLINKAAFAVQAIFIFTLFSGIMVLFAALQSQQAERRKEIAILKSMGATHTYLRKIILTEFILIGSIAGFIAAGFATLVSNLLAYQLFNLNPDINFYLLLMGIISGGTLVGIGGYINLRPLFKLTPKALFQE